MLNKVKELSKKKFNDLVDLRRDIHANPEIGGEEFRTQSLIINYLNKLQVFDVVKSADTGVVAVIKGTKEESNKCIGLRADIDALGIEDMKEVGYKSKNKGLCHACGHDVHTTILLGVASNLAKLQNQFSGYVKLFFQPAEENIGGAERMINEGFMENPHVNVMLGLHVSENYDVGQVRFCYGTMQASSDEISIVVKGYSAHAAHPENGVDAILIACQIVNNLQSIPSRNVSPTDSIALSLGKIQGGTVTNALAENVKIEGTLRTLSFKTREKVIQRIKDIVEGVAKAYGGSAELIVDPSYPPVINNEELNDFVKNNALEFIDSKDVIINNVPSLGVEDFAYFAQKVPSCFYNLGIRNIEKGIIYPGHNNKFDVDEESIFYGVVLQTISALKYLQ